MKRQTTHGQSRARRWRSSVCVAACAAASVMHAAPAVGQVGGTQAEATGETEREVIIVTARRVTENLQQVPLTIGVIGLEEIERNNVQGIDDIARLTPGLTYDIGGFPNDTRPALRGMQAERGRPSVAVMLDGIDLSTENLAISGGGAGVETSILDIERIEVVKGPKSTLYGRNAFAGAINYISRRPEFETAIVGGVEFAEDSAAEARVSMTGPIVADKLAYRLNLATRTDSGRYDNPVTGGSLGGEDFAGGALALLAKPTQNLEINTRIQITETDQTDLPTAFLVANERLPVPGGTFTAGPPGTPPSDCPASLTGAPASVVTACTRGTYVGPVTADISDVQMGLNPLTGAPPSGMDVDQTVASFDARWDTEHGEFRYQLGYQRNDSYIETDGDFTDFPGPPGFVFSTSALQELDYGNEHFDHTVMWLKQSGPFAFLLGAQLLDEDSTLRNDSKFWLRNPESPLAGPPFFLANQPQETGFPVLLSRDTQYRALFGSVQWNVSEDVRVSVEGRQNEDEITFTLPGWRLQDTTLSQLTPVCLPDLPQGATFMGVAGPNVPPPGTVVACPRADTLSFSEFTPRGTIDWQATETAFVYATVARGYKPGGYNVNEIIDFAGQAYLPEFVTAYEVGVKTEWLDRALVVNADVYFNDYTDQQIGIQRNQQGANDTVVAVPGIGNAGAVETRGIEVDANWRADNGLEFTLGYAYTDAEFTSYVQGPPPGATPEEFAACGVPEGQTSSTQLRTEAGNFCADFSGNKVAKSPEHALNFNVFYSRDFGADRSWFVEAAAQYQSKRFVDESNRSWLPEHTLVDLTAGVELGDLALTAFVRNVTDDDTIRSAQRQVNLGTPEGFAPGRAVVAYLPEPRTFGVRASYRFR